MEASQLEKELKSKTGERKTVRDTCYSDADAHVQALIGHVSTPTSPFTDSPLRGRAATLVGYDPQQLAETELELQKLREQREERLDQLHDELQDVCGSAVYSMLTFATGSE